MASDDRVRGGKSQVGERGLVTVDGPDPSQSYLDCAADGSHARFHGHLDIQTLGGAGFASQRTTSDDRSWDLAAYDGIELVVSRADGQCGQAASRTARPDMVSFPAKRYTLILKDTLPPPRSQDGRDQSTPSYEYDFCVGDSATARAELFIPWHSFKATYRGREKKDAPTIDVKSVKRVSVMMRRWEVTTCSEWS